MAEHHGAPDGDALGPVGGGTGYGKHVARPGSAATTIDELVDALTAAKEGDIVYLADDAELDLTVRVRACGVVLAVPAGVTLASGRGRDGSPGALLESDELATQPFIRAGGPGVRVTGLRIVGPDRKVRHDEIMRIYNHPEYTLDKGGYYSFPISMGIETTHPGLEVDNCELSGWGNTAVSILPGAFRAHVHHCDIHQCQRAGLGYGVLPHGADALIECNRFDWMRHSIAGSGVPGTAYEARYNVHGPHSLSHCFDMHGSHENHVLVDGRTIAGEYILIHHNTFHSPQPGVGIRAIPRERCAIHHNWFASDEPVGTRVKLYGEEPLAHPEAFGVRDNVAGSDRRPWEFDGGR